MQFNEPDIEKNICDMIHVQDSLQLQYSVYIQFLFSN
jgi:hypothetical protein